MAKLYQADVCERIDAAGKTPEPVPDPFRAFVDRLAGMSAPDLDNMSNDETYEKAREFADLIAEAYELTQEAKPAAKPWFGWVATYGDFGLQVAFFDTRKPFDKAIGEAEREHAKGDLDTFTYGEEA